MERNPRTWLCSVLFLDIVGYTTHPMEYQMALKRHFGNTLAKALKHLPAEDCITADAGDGAAVCYLGDPEDILYVGVGLRDTFAALDERSEVHYAVRLGINLGPVKILEDINGLRNTVGDGINVAQRVMNFAQANQLLVSRSYYDVVSRLSTANERMFAYLGIYKDKHVREHAVYEVVPNAHSADGGAIKVVDVDGSPVPVPRAAPGGRFDPAELDQLSRRLAAYIGPVARLLVNKAARSADSLDSLCATLAQDIPDDTDRKRFLQGRTTDQD